MSEIKGEIRRIGAAGRADASVSNIGEGMLSRLFGPTFMRIPSQRKDCAGSSDVNKRSYRYGMVRRTDENILE